MSKEDVIEIRVRPVVRQIVTRYNSQTGGSAVIGEFANEELANEIARLIAHDSLPIPGMSYQWRVLLNGQEYPIISVGKPEVKTLEFFRPNDLVILKYLSGEYSTGQVAKVHLLDNDNIRYDVRVGSDNQLLTDIESKYVLAHNAISLVDLVPSDFVKSKVFSEEPVKVPEKVVLFPPGTLITMNWNNRGPEPGVVHAVAAFAEKTPVYNIKLDKNGEVFNGVASTCISARQLEKPVFPPNRMVSEASWP